MRPFL